MNSRSLPIIALALAIGIFFGYISPAWGGTITNLRADIARADQALNSAAQFSSQQNQLASARDAIDPQDISRLETFLPDSVDNVGMILDLTALASRSGLQLSKIDVASNASGGSQGANITNQGPVASVDMSLTALGSYAALQKFLVGIEKSARLLDVRELSIKGSETGVYSYQMKLRLYWLR